MLACRRCGRATTANVCGRSLRAELYANMSCHLPRSSQGGPSGHCVRLRCAARTVGLATRSGGARWFCSFASVAVLAPSRIAQAQLTQVVVHRPSMACTPKKSLDPARVPMCALAKKVTPVKKTGNTASDMDAQLKRQSMVELLNVADAFPDHIDAVVRYFTERVRKEQQAGGVDGERFDEATACSGVHSCSGGRAYGLAPHPSVRSERTSANP